MYCRTASCAATCLYSAHCIICTCESAAHMLVYLSAAFINFDGCHPSAEVKLACALQRILCNSDEAAACLCFATSPSINRQPSTASKTVTCRSTLGRDAVLVCSSISSSASVRLWCTHHHRRSLVFQQPAAAAPAEHESRRQ